MTVRSRAARDRAAATVNRALEGLAKLSVSRANPLGRLLGSAVRRIPPTTRMPVLRGALRGKRWIAGSGNHAVWLGSYEYLKRGAFERVVAPGSVVFDVGAHVGYYTLLASVLVGPEGHVVAFEPAPRNLVFLRQHLAINRVTNVTVVPQAVSDAAGTIAFAEGSEGSLGYTGRISPHGALVVETVSLDDLVASGVIPPPDTIKIDVEGAEAAVLAGARATLALHHPTVFLATHGAEAHAQCRVALRAHGYTLTPIDTNDLDTAREVLARHEDGTATYVAPRFAAVPVARTVLRNLLRILFFVRILASRGQRRHAWRWLQSLRRDYLLDRAMPWLTFDAIDALDGQLHAGARVFEYGSGGSTLFWLRHGAECVSVEHDAGWYARLHPRLANDPRADYRLVLPEPIAADTPPGDPADPEAYASADPGLRHCTFRAYAAQVDAFPDGSFAVVSVDGRARAACIMHAARKVAVGGILILDNAERAYYTERAGAFLRGFTRTPFFGVGPCGAAMWRTDIYRRES